MSTVLGIYNFGKGCFANSSLHSIALEAGNHFISLLCQPISRSDKVGIIADIINDYVLQTVYVLKRGNSSIFRSKIRGL